jgi:beta-1,4-mannosyl-glycoprotein beta-1,4-N-acetylglucosaminyltransferase
MGLVYDAFTYNGEKEILDIRLNILNRHVDKFVIVEAKTTFTGQPKPLYFSQQEFLFKKWWNKIEYYIIDENYTGAEIRLAEKSPNTQGAEHWKREFLQKEKILCALKHCNLSDNDTVYVGDVDEIWEPIHSFEPVKLKLKVYAYYLNNRSSEEFWGTLVARYGMIKGQCLNHMRSDTSIRTLGYYGHHFTSIGGLSEVQRKLDASYTSESYNTKSVRDNLPTRVSLGIDYLGRDFTFTRDESEWPDYLVKHRSKYQHLLL